MIEQRKEQELLKKELHLENELKEGRITQEEHDLQIEILNLNNNIIDSIASSVNFNDIWQINLQSNHLKSIRVNRE